MMSLPVGTKQCHASGINMDLTIPMLWSSGATLFAGSAGNSFLRGHFRPGIIQLTAAICCYAITIFQLYEINARSRL